MESRTNQTKEYTQKDLSKEKNLSICLVSIFGKVYNVAKYLPHHPGGEKALYDAGGDILDDVFTSGTHKNFKGSVELLLKKYEVGILK